MIRHRLAGSLEARDSFLADTHVAFTNATAVSPTDTLPLTAYAKLLIMVKSAVSLLTIALVVGRAISMI